MKLHGSNFCIICTFSFLLNSTCMREIDWIIRPQEVYRSGFPNHYSKKEGHVLFQQAEWPRSITGLRKPTENALTGMERKKWLSQLSLFDAVKAPPRVTSSSLDGTSTSVPLYTWYSFYSEGNTGACCHVWNMAQVFILLFASQYVPTHHAQTAFLT